jgi:hypothetical protein
MKHREHLEEPVKERTTELRTANEQLQKEMTVRRLTINDQRFILTFIRE